MPEFAIKVNGLGKQYRIGTKRYRHTTLGEAVLSRLGQFFKMASQRFSPASKLELLWALQDITFEIRQGEVLGIIGHNGAGKSTLLKILSRITKPSKGYAQVYGRIGSMLEVGTGFHPELTGRDNIYLSGAIQGMAHQEIRRKFDAIVDFSGIERLIDTPVKHYSSGMYLRLGFAVAAHLEPDILLVDEVLAVGDVGFQQKCLDKLQEIIRNGHTVLFVSHNMAAIEGLSGRTLWLDHGMLRGDGATSQVIHAYLDSSAAPVGEKIWVESPTMPHVTEFRLIAVRVKDKNERVWSEINADDSFTVEIEYELYETLPYCRIGIVLVSAEGIELFETYDSDNAHYGSQRKAGRYVSRCIIPGALLKPGRYHVQANAGIVGAKKFMALPNAITFHIVEATALKSIDKTGRRGVISPDIQWMVATSEQAE